MSSPASSYSRPGAIAPVWHTCALLVLLTLLSAWAVYVRMGSASARLSHIPIYLVVIASEWALFAFSLWRADPAFVATVARVIRDPRSLLWDIPTALVLSAALIFISPGIIRVLGPKGWGSTQGMLPNNGIEIALWVLMSITAGICEETIFRGYLQQQIAGWTRYPLIGAVSQGVLFGVLHAYQGWKNVALITVWGCIFGLCAWLRKGLRANMIAHASLDIFSAFR